MRLNVREKDIGSYVKKEMEYINGTYYRLVSYLPPLSWERGIRGGEAEKEKGDRVRQKRSSGMR